MGGPRPMTTVPLTVVALQRRRVGDQRQHADNGQEQDDAATHRQVSA